MTRGSRKSGANAARKARMAAEPPRPKPAPCTIRNPSPDEARRILARAKIKRMEQDEIFRGLLKKHRGEIPVESLFDLRAVRLQAVRAG